MTSAPPVPIPEELLAEADATAELVGLPHLAPHLRAVLGRAFLVGYVAAVQRAAERAATWNDPL